MLSIFQRAVFSLVPNAQCVLGIDSIISWEDERKKPNKKQIEETILKITQQEPLRLFLETAHYLLDQSEWTQSIYTKKHQILHKEIQRLWGVYRNEVKELIVLFSGTKQKQLKLDKNNQLVFSDWPIPLNSIVIQKLIHSDAQNWRNEKSYLEETAKIIEQYENEKIRAKGTTNANNSIYRSHEYELNGLDLDTMIIDMWNHIVAEGVVPDSPIGIKESIRQQIKKDWSK